MSEWKNLKLEQIADIIDPHPSHRAPAIDDRGIPFIGIGDIDEHGNLTKNARKVSLTIFDDHQLRYKLNKNTIGFGRVATIGKIIRFKDYSIKFTVSPTMAIIQPKSVESTFLAKSLGSPFVKEQIDRLLTGSTRSSLGIELLRDLIIPVPSFAIQSKIANILISADALIENTQSTIAKYKAIKQGMLHDLFTRGIDAQTGKLRPKYDDAPELYKESELGMIPNEWKSICLEELCKEKPTYGINAAAVDFSYGLPTYLRITDIDENGKFIKNGRKSVCSIFSNQYILKKGDLVFARTGATVGKTYLYDKSDGPLVFAGFLIKVSPDEKKLNSNFLKFLTETPYYLNWVGLMSQRSGQPGINGVEYANFKIPTPDCLEQNVISNKLLSIQNKISSEQAYLQKLQQIKTGLMNDLLTGKKEVTVAE